MRPLLPSILAASLIVSAALAADNFAADESTADRRAAIARIAAKLETSYVSASVAAEMAAMLQAKSVAGDYDPGPLSSLADQLTADLYRVSRDGHLRVRHHSDPAQVMPAWNQPAPDAEARYREHGRRTNFGFTRVEILPGNIGYLRLDEFGDPALGGDTAAAVMRFVTNTDALLIDLRANGGGGGMGSVLASYLFEGATIHLSNFEIRERGETLQLWTAPYVPGPRYTRPVFLLTGPGTASAAESFAYMLHNRKRVKLVGGKTAGAANPGGYVRISEHLAIFVPDGRPVDPLTGSNWEGTGIQPDIEGDVAAALDLAHTRALEDLIATTGADPGKRAAWNEALTVLQSRRRQSPP
jgi:hypothetical protein